MSGYIEIKIRTTRNPSDKFVSGILNEIAGVFQVAGFEGSVKCTNTQETVPFKEEIKPKMGGQHVKGKQIESVARQPNTSTESRVEKEISGGTQKG